MKNFLRITCLVAVGIIVAAVQVHATSILDDSFSYPNGNLAGNATWTTYSGAGTDIQVVSGQAQFNTANTPDDKVSLGPTFSSGALYACFTLDMTSLPTANGNYFALFTDGGTVNFRGRVFVTTQGAAAGQFRAGILNSTGNTISGVVFPLNLS